LHCDIERSALVNGCTWAGLKWHTKFRGIFWDKCQKSYKGY